MRACIAIVILLNVFMAHGEILERGLPTSVFIVANQGSSDLEIITEYDVFELEYNKGEQQFNPLHIPFKVRSISGEYATYDLSMSQLAGVCNGLLDLNLTVTLDGNVIELHEKHRSSGIENSHMMVIEFPVVAQLLLPQKCEGSVSIVAELAV